MLRKIIFTTVVLLFLGGLAYMYLHVKEIKQPTSKAISAIPVSAAVIMQNNKTHEIWNKVSETNMMWEQLIETKYIHDVNAQIKTLDSIVASHPKFDQLIIKQPFYISIHMSGATKFDYLFSLNIPATFDADQIHDFVAEQQPNVQEKNYDEATIHSFKTGENTFHYTIYEGVFVASFSGMLIEESIRQLNAEKSLLDDRAFMEVYNTAGRKIDGNIFFNYHTAPPLFKTFLKEEYSSHMKNLTDLADWSELDFKIKPNTLMLNGFTYSSDSVNNYLNVFAHQKPQPIEAIEVLPFNTAILVHFGFSDFSKFKHDYVRYLEKSNRLFEYGVALKRLSNKIAPPDKQGSISIEEKLFEWVENEIALAITEPNEVALAANSYAIFKSKNLEMSKENLTELAMLADSNYSSENIVNFKGFELDQIKLPELLSHLFGAQFSLITKNHFTILSDYVVFANSQEALKGLINNYLTDRTLDKDVNYISYSDNLASESNIFMYSNIARSTNIYRNFANKEYADEIEKNTELYQKFEALSVQISKDKHHLFYNNIFLKYNPVYKQETRSLWETALDAHSSSKPTLITNHYSGAKEILVQDDDKNLHLISNTGKKLWSVPLEEKIEGEIKQIDVYKNGKLQLIFNTNSHIYCLDRNGKAIPNFPVSLSDTTSAPMKVMDYDNNHNYRILVPLASGETKNYNIGGETVKGWDCKSTTPIISDIKHVAIKGKDYIIGICEDGQVKIVDRRGKDRLTLKEKFQLPKHGRYFIDKNKDLSKSYLVTTDTLGNVIKLTFKGDRETIKLKEMSPNHKFIYADLDGDHSKEYIYINEAEALVYDQDKILIFDYTFDAPVTAAPKVFRFSETQLAFGVSGATDEIYLFNNMGALFPSFPLAGSTPFSIGDINKDGKFNLVVGSKDQNIYTYTLEIQ